MLRAGSKIVVHISVPGNNLYSERWAEYMSLSFPKASFFEVFHTIEVHIRAVFGNRSLSMPDCAEQVSSSGFSYTTCWNSSTATPYGRNKIADERWENLYFSVSSLKKSSIHGHAKKLHAHRMYLTCFVCRPEIFLDAVIAALVTLGKHVLPHVSAPSMSWEVPLKFEKMNGALYCEKWVQYPPVCLFFLLTRSHQVILHHKIKKTLLSPETVLHTSSCHSHDPCRVAF